MPLTVGTNTYVDEATAAEYCSEYGLDPLSSAESSLKQATAAIDRLYGGRWIGRKEQVDQALAWPRVVDTDEHAYTLDSYGEWRTLRGVPDEVQDATVELAVLIEAGFDPYVQPNPSIQSESMNVGGIASSVTYSSTHKVSRHWKIDLLLRPLIKATGSIAIKR